MLRQLFEAFQQEPEIQVGRFTSFYVFPRNGIQLLYSEIYEYFEMIVRKIGITLICPP